MASGGDVPSWQRKRARGQRRRRQAASLPVDIMAEIAARTDPVTLVRCAATCSDLRGPVADPAFRLRLRHAGRRRFVPSLLRGHLVGDSRYSVKTAAGASDERIYLVDPAATTGAAAGLLRRDSDTFPPGPDGEPLRLHTPLSARDGLVLVRGAHELRVCNLATGRTQTVPHGPGFTGIHHVLLVGGGEGEGGGAVGRPFQVVKARLVLGRYSNYLQVQTFSSELGMWGPCTKIETPQIYGHANLPLKGRPLVAGGAVHWLCLTSRAGFVLKLRVRAAAAPPRLTVTELPESYPHSGGGQGKHLLATMTAGGSPAVLVADTEKISAWTMSKDGTRWHRQPQVIIEYEAISRFVASVSEERLQLPQQVWPPPQVNLGWFAERSGIVLIRMHDHYFFWLNLQSKEIVAWTSDPRIRYRTIYCPCEMDLSTWVPTFSSSLIA